MSDQATRSSGGSRSLPATNDGVSLEDLMPIVLN
jgi:hypothetical protein